MLNTMIKILALSMATLISMNVSAAPFKIEQVDGKVYRFIDDRHRSIFVVTDEGIIVTDPMNREAATWLKAELAKRFDKPVKYVVYSHNHSDHIYGGEVFDGAHTVFIAHELAYQDMVTTRAKTRLPDLHFQTGMSLISGQHEIELRYHGPNDGRGSISMLVKPEKVLFVVDWIVIGRMPWRKLWSYDIQGMINSTREVLQLDFDTIVGGHADIGSKADVRRYLSYLEDLYAIVLRGINQGKSLKDIQRDADLSAYSDLANYDDWLADNIEGVYKRLMNESGMGWRPE